MPFSLPEGRPCNVAHLVAYGVGLRGRVTFGAYVKTGNVEWSGGRMSGGMHPMWNQRMHLSHPIWRLRSSVLLSRLRHMRQGVGAGASSSGGDCMEFVATQVLGWYPRAVWARTCWCVMCSGCQCVQYSVTS